MKHRSGFWGSIPPDKWGPQARYFLGTICLTGGAQQTGCVLESDSLDLVLPLTGHMTLDKLLGLSKL